jgi:hypothetical protein
MLAEAKKALAQILSSAVVLQNANGAGRIFELYVMVRIGRELQSRSYDVWLQRSDETRVLPQDSDRRFIQRGGSPTGIPAKTLGTNNASAIVFSKPGSSAKWEIWNGIQHRGRSGALHEIDIAIVPEEVGRELRLKGGMPFGRPRIAIECKDVGTTGNVDEARALVARLYDLTILQWHQPYIGQAPPTQCIYPGNFNGLYFYAARKTYWAENRHTFNAIARRTGFAKGTGRLMAHYSVESHSLITVGSAEADMLVVSIADWIDQNLP